MTYRLLLWRGWEEGVYKRHPWVIEFDDADNVMGAFGPVNVIRNAAVIETIVRRMEEEQFVKPLRSCRNGHVVGVRGYCKECKLAADRRNLKTPLGILRVQRINAKRALRRRNARLARGRQCGSQS